ncbi:MAG: hypothetical protein GY842_19880, partial [bacterium]|nr:hypothetical protein [bacterium]
MTVRFAVRAAAILLVPWTLTACKSTTPSARVQNQVQLPIPRSAGVETVASPALDTSGGGTLGLSARSLITLAFNRQPDITSSFAAFKAEEARYDFFYASHDALTPRFRMSNTLEESRTPDAETG